MPRLHIFNPETDFALASGSPYYTPPRSVVRMRAELALLPISFAEPGDAVLVIDDDVDIPKCNFPIYRPYDNIDWSQYEAYPWGWNNQIAHFLSINCPNLKGIPSEHQLTRIRNLSHRRTTIGFLREINAAGIELPIEFNNVQDAIKYYDLHSRIFFKAPWSSSGRGILYTADLNREQTEQWIRGIIRSQGSVMAENAYPKQIDCATEWRTDSKGVHFLGISVFEASTRGKYHHNVRGTQAELWDLIPGITPELIERQRNAIQKIIAPEYAGPLGIDMLVTDDCEIHPCIEINLRNTMGSILIRPDDLSLIDKFPSLFN